MRDFYAMQQHGGAIASTPGAYERRILQIVTLGFWGPCCAADLWLLRQGGGESAGFVFWLLFREAVVFLALWFGASAARGLMRGSLAPKAPDARQRRKLQARLVSSFKGYVAPTRGNRGQ